MQPQRVAGVRRTVGGMLTRLRDPSGGPSLRVRLVSLLVVLGLVLITAPLVVVPLMHWLLDSALP